MLESKMKWIPRFIDQFAFYTHSAVWLFQAGWYLR